jgi:hypothetical protein
MKCVKALGERKLYNFRCIYNNTSALTSKEVKMQKCPSLPPFLTPLSISPCPPFLCFVRQQKFEAGNANVYTVLALL